MEISCTIKENVTYVSLVGQFWDPEDIRAFEKIIGACVQERRNRVVLDVDRLSFINSLGLGQLVKAHKTLTDAGGGVVIFRPRSMVLDVIEVSGFQMFMSVVQGEEELNNSLLSLGGSS